MLLVPPYPWREQGSKSAERRQQDLMCQCYLDTHCQDQIMFRAAQPQHKLQVCARPWFASQVIVAGRTEVQGMLGGCSILEGAPPS